MEQIFVGSTHLKKQIANLVFGLLYRLHEIPLKYSIFLVSCTRCGCQENF